MNRTPIYLSALGILNALGNGCNEVLENLLQCNPVGMAKRTDLLINGEVNVGQVNAELQTLPKQYSRYNSRNNRLLITAYQQIEVSTKALIEEYGAHRIGVVIGSSTSGIAEGEEAIKQYINNAELPSTYHYRQQEMGSAAECLAEYIGLTSVAMTVSTACSSSAKIFDSARKLIEVDLCDAVLVGGADSLCRLTVNGFSALESVSSSICKPFSRNRDGITIGEGAALFLMTKKPIASPFSNREDFPIRLLGVGSASDAHHISAPHPQGKGAIAAMYAALNDAQLTPDRICYVNLHGTGTKQNDAMESIATHSVFGANKLCGSTKALTGHMLGAAGATEVAFCWLLLTELNRERALPPHSWDDEPDESLASLNLVPPDTKIPEQGAEISEEVFMMSNSYAFGGNNVSVIIGREGRNSVGNNIAKRFTVREVVPHAGKMVLLDEILDCNENSLTASLLITEETLFLDNMGRVPAWVGIEYMAQAVAAWAGTHAKIAGRPVQLGYLLGTRKYIAHVDNFLLGSRLTVTVKMIYRDNELGVFDCAIATDNLLVEASINVYQPEVSSNKLS